MRRRNYMPEWVKWLFDGIGTEIIAGIVGLLIGGVGGFAIGKNTTSKPTQKAGDSSKQKQFFTVDYESDVNSKSKQETNTIIQRQKAKNNSEQIQAGRVKHEQ